jgi:serine protease
MLAFTAAAAFAQLQEGAYPSLTAEQIAAEFPKIDNEYIVQFKEGSTDEHIQTHLTAVKGMDAEVHKEWHIKTTDVTKEFRGYHMTVKNSDASAAMKFIQARFSDEVKLVEQNAIVKASKADCGMQSGATWGIVRTAEVNNDKNGFYEYDTVSGEGVSAYVIDTGIRCTHNEFTGRCRFGADFAYSPSPQSDLNGHGTHVAGTVGGTVYGVAKNVELVAVAVLGASGSGSNAGVISGVEWSANDRGNKRGVGNMSLGGGFSTASNNAVNAAVASGLAMVVASGNSNTNSCTFSPASADNAITVDSSTNLDQRSSFSNYGACSDIVAPGSSITAAWINSDTSINTISGTSMAAPHVAGVAAKLLGERNYTPAQLKTELTRTATVGMVSGFPNNPQPLLHMDCEMSRAKMHANLRATVA